LSAKFWEDLARHDVPQFAILTSDGQVIGMIQYAEESDPEYRHASIDLYVDPSSHRRGYGSDAIRTLADYLFDERGHHRLTIDPAVENKAAIECYQGVGFQTVGVMRAYERTAQGEWSDGLLMDMLTTDEARGSPPASTLVQRCTRNGAASPGVGTWPTCGLFRGLVFRCRASSWRHARRPDPGSPCPSCSHMKLAAVRSSHRAARMARPMVVP